MLSAQRSPGSPPGQPNAAMPIHRPQLRLQISFRAFPKWWTGESPLELAEAVTSRCRSRGATAPLRSQTRRPEVRRQWRGKAGIDRCCWRENP